MARSAKRDGGAKGASGAKGSGGRGAKTGGRAPAAPRRGRARPGEASADLAVARRHDDSRPSREEIDASGETPLSLEEQAAREQREDDLFLAREFLTWLVFHAETAGGGFDGTDEVPEFTIAFGGRLTLRSPAGLVTDMTLKGPSPATSPDLRYALAGGLAVKEADLRLEQDDRAFQFGLAAEHFDLKRVKLPELLTEEDDEREIERLALLDQLDAALRHAFGAFLAQRVTKAWAKTIVPAMRDWLATSTRP